MRLALMMVGLFLCGCAAPVVVPAPYASRLSSADVQRLKSLVLAERGDQIAYGTIRIEAYARDRVRVFVASPQHPYGGTSSDVYTYVNRDGKWILDRNAFYQRVDLHEKW
jgi:hypothetical protein